MNVFRRFLRRVGTFRGNRRHHNLGSSYGEEKNRNVFYKQKDHRLVLIAIKHTSFEVVGKITLEDRGRIVHGEVKIERRSKIERKRKM